MQSVTLGNQFKPAILQCFGDIAQAIGGHFETYLPIVAQVLQQASALNVGAETSYEMLDYVVSLREGIMDAWDGAIIAMKSSDKSKLRQHEIFVMKLLTTIAQLLAPFVESVFSVLHTIHTDTNRTEALLRSCMGVIG